MAESLAIPTAVVMGFHALSDPLRIHVIELLRHQELCVCDLCEAIGVAQSKLSFHLKILKDAQLVQCRQAGRWSYYSLSLSQFMVLEKYLAEYSQQHKILPTRSCSEEY